MSIKPMTPEHRAALSKALKAKWASGTRKPTPRSAYEKSSQTKKQQSKAGTLKQMSPEKRAAVSSMGGKAVSNDPVLRAKRELLLKQRAIEKIGKPNPPGPSEAGVNNWKAKWWHLRAPTGESLFGKNLNEIIRKRSHLFEPEDIVWKRSQCRASKGIGALGHSSGTSCSWKGWTLVSRWENGDLIARNLGNSFDNLPLPV